MLDDFLLTASFFTFDLLFIRMKTLWGLCSSLKMSSRQQRRCNKTKARSKGEENNDGGEGGKNKREGTEWLAAETLQRPCGSVWDGCCRTSRKASRCNKSMASKPPLVLENVNKTFKSSICPIVTIYLVSVSLVCCCHYSCCHPGRCVNTDSLTFGRTEPQYKAFQKAS